MSSLCDKCFSPGACCKGFTITSVGPDGGESATWWTDEGEAGIKRELEKKGWPFEVDIIGDQNVSDEDDGRTYATVWFKCPELTPEGRCGIYDRRPELCRTYEPRQSPLCVHYNGAESGDGSAESGRL